MHMQDIFAAHPTTLSFEFFPPKTDKGLAALEQTLDELQPLKPAFIDVTYGAGGGTRDRTLDLVRKLHETRGLPIIPHMTTVCHQEHEVREVIDHYHAWRIDNVLALSGDLPRDKPDYDRGQDAFRYAAQLVRWLREYNETHEHPNGRGFGIGVAGFPEGHHATQNRMDELHHLKDKCDEGADWICTQFCFDTPEILDWRERLEVIGCKTPVLIGIMPITSYQMYQKLPEFGLGAKYPSDLMKQVEDHKDDDDAIMKIGIAWAIEQCRVLLEHHVRGLHFYTLNKPEATLAIYEALGLKQRVIA
ncbi:MAG: methylenetetrahydrofolate reductase [Phycisphaeraceae bacterium]